MSNKTLIRTFYKYLDGFSSRSVDEQKDVCLKLLSFLCKHIQFSQFFDDKYALICEADWTLSAARQYYVGKLKDREKEYLLRYSEETIKETYEMWECTDETEARTIIYNRFYDYEEDRYSLFERLLPLLTQIAANKKMLLDLISDSVY